jgi:hypothetical protein
MVTVMPESLLSEIVNDFPFSLTEMLRLVDEPPPALPPALPPDEENPEPPPLADPEAPPDAMPPQAEALAVRDDVLRPLPPLATPPL